MTCISVTCLVLQEPTTTCREPPQLHPTEKIRDRALLVSHVSLLEEAPLLEPAVEPSLDDLRDGGLWLPLVPGDGLGSPALSLDEVCRHVLPAQVLGSGEGYVYRDVMGEVLAAAVQLDQHGIHAPAVLQVQVAAEHRVRRCLETHASPDGDILLERGSELLHSVALFLERARTPDGQLGGELVDELDEFGGLGDEIGLALERDDRADRVRPRLALHDHRHGTLGPVSTLALAGAHLPLFPQQLGGLVQVPVRLIERLAAVKDAGACSLS